MPEGYIVLMPIPETDKQCLKSNPYTGISEIKPILKKLS